MHLGILKEDYMKILDYAKLNVNKDFRVVSDLGVETLSKRATERLNIFIRAAEKVWKLLSMQVRYWRKKRLAVKLQTLLRAHLAMRRHQRVSVAVADLQSLLGLMANVKLILGPKRRAAVRIQSFFRMCITRNLYRKLLNEKYRTDAATKIQARFRGTFVRQRTSPELAKHKMINAIKIMQASIRRLLCTKIIYLSAVKRLRNEAATTLQCFFRSILFKRKVRDLRALRFLAVRAKFIAFILAHAQVRLARFMRGYMVRKHHPFQVARIRYVRSQGKVAMTRRLAATKIRNFWKSWVIRKQYLYIRRLTVALQVRLRTSLAVREYVGPRIPGVPSLIR